MQQLRHQRGGTFWGLVLGVVIGLAIALGVALYVTKVPVTFVNKVLNRSAEQDAQEVQKNKNWDPNTPLYGKNPARPSSAADDSAAAAQSGTTSANADTTAPAAGAGPSASASASASPMPASSETGSASPVATVPSADPIGDLARSKGLVAAPAAALDPFTYYIQVGAFRNDADAQAFKNKLSQEGFDAKVSQRDQAGRPVFRVRLGPFQTRDETNGQREALTNKGFETVVVRVQR